MLSKRLSRNQPGLLLRPITKGPNRAMNQLEFLAITCDLLIGFCFASY